MFLGIKLEDSDPAGEIKSNIWQSLNIIRGSLSTSEYHFVLLLLTLQKKGLLDELTSSNHEFIKFRIEQVIRKLDWNTERPLIEVFNFYAPILNRIDDIQTFEIIRLLGSLDQALLHKHFSEIFDHVLYHLSSLQGRLGGESMLPAELSRFVCALSSISENADVYNPFAGYASFAISLNHSVSYFGQEINQTTWAIGLLRLMAYGRPGLSDFITGDSINDWNPKRKWQFGREKFDLIISNPPFGERLRGIDGRFGEIKSIEHFLIEKGLEDLKPNGKLIAVISQGFLFRGGSEHNLREYLVDNNLLEMVISFPGGLLLNTSIPFSVVVINKEMGALDVTRFIDATSFVDRINFSERWLNVDNLISFIQGTDETEFARYVRSETIKIAEYNLSVPRYFQKTFTGVNIRTLLSLIRGDRSHSQVTGYMVKVKDLKADAFIYSLDIDELELGEIPTRAPKIGESCLLVAAIGTKLKATFFNYSEIPIYLNPNILAFKVDTTKIDIEYLIHELYSRNTIEQITSLYTGAVIPRLRIEDVLSIKIEIPTLPEQKAKVKGLKEEHIKARENQLSLERKLLGFRDDAFREFASMKHTFRQYLNALKTNVSGTNKFIAKNANQPIGLNTVYSRNLNRTFGEHLVSLEGIIDSMSKLLSSIEENPLALDAVESDLRTLVEEAQLRFANNDVFQFEKLYVDFDSFSQVEGEYIAPLVSIHPDDFFRVFSNIVSNAIEHGFKGKENNIIRTSLSFDAENLLCVLEVSNNGAPMDEGFTIKHLTTRGEKTVDSRGSGIGGSDIKNIVEKYDGSVDIRKDKDAEFAVTYIVSLPIVVYRL